MTPTESTASRRALLSGALGLGGLGSLAAFAPAAIAASPPVPEDPSSAYFLKLDGVKGDSRDQAHAGEIDLLTWGTGVSTAADPLSTSGGAGAGKSKPQPFTFVARTGSASPKLFQLVCTGKHVKTAVLSVRRFSGDTVQQYLTVTLQDVVVSSYEIAPGEVDGYPIDVGQLDFAKITISYRPQLPTGQLGEPITFGFDFAANKPI
jgi:type VI secretion system secreted protein Hcp